MEHAQYKLIVLLVLWYAREFMDNPFLIKFSFILVVERKQTLFAIKFLLSMQKINKFCIH